MARQPNLPRTIQQNHESRRDFLSEFGKYALGAGGLLLLPKALAGCSPPSPTINYNIGDPEGKVASSTIAADAGLCNADGMGRQLEAKLRRRSEPIELYGAKNIVEYLDTSDFFFENMAPLDEANKPFTSRYSFYGSGLPVETAAGKTQDFKPHLYFEGRYYTLQELSPGLQVVLLDEKEGAKVSTNGSPVEMPGGEYTILVKELAKVNDWFEVSLEAWNKHGNHVSQKMKLGFPQVLDFGEDWLGVVVSKNKYDDQLIVTMLGRIVIISENSLYINEIQSMKAKSYYPSSGSSDSVFVEMKWYQENGADYSRDYLQSITIYRPEFDRGSCGK